MRLGPLTTTLQTKRLSESTTLWYMAVVSGKGSASRSVRDTKYLADVFAGLKLLTEDLTPHLAILRCSRMPTGSVLLRVSLLGCHRVNSLTSQWRQIQLSNEAVSS